MNEQREKSAIRDGHRLAVNFLSAISTLLCVWMHKQSSSKQINYVDGADRQKERSKQNQ